jgi:hypothetical protein
MDARQEPITFGATYASRPSYLSEGILRVTQADWLYRALDELTLKTVPPLWTKDEWTFTPVNIARLPNNTISQKTGSKSESEQTSALVTSRTNVSLVTPALRSRLECSTVQVPPSGWLDRAEEVYPERTNEAIHGYVLPAILFEDTPYKTPVFTVPRRMGCCTNSTISGGQSVIAYWSSNTALTEKRPAQAVDMNGPLNLKEPRVWSENFTIKWIVGPTSSTIISGRDPANNTITGFVVYGNETLLYFTEEPRMAMLNCIPIIEKANASITIARSTGQILEAKLLDKPQPAHEAWDYAWDLVYPKPTSNYSSTNVR